MGTLIGISGSFNGKSITLIPNREFIVGKDVSSDICIDPSYREVSRKHMGITYDSVANRYILIDYSTNGTYINGMKLEHGRKYYINGGERISLGKGENVFELGNISAQPQYTPQQADVNQIYAPMETNGIATASLVMGILSLVLPTMIFGLLAIIFGAVGVKKKINHGSAVAGLVCGIISFVFDIILIILIVVSAAAATSYYF